MSANKKFIILPYSGERVEDDRLMIKNAIKIEMDDVYKFLDYVDILEKIATAVKKKDNSKLQKLINKLDNFITPFIHEQDLEKKDQY